MGPMMNNPVFQNLDPLKQELMRTAFERTRGKTGRNLAPVMMSLITQANQKGIRFSEEEMTLILQFLKGREKSGRTSQNRSDGCLCQCSLEKTDVKQNQI